MGDYTAYLLEELCERVNVVAVSPHVTPAVRGADLVHIQHQYFLYGGVAPWKNRFAATLRSLRHPVVMTVHEFVEPFGGPMSRLAVKLTNRLQFHQRAIRRLIVHTRWDRDRMVRSGVPAERVVVIRHGVPKRPQMPGAEEAKDALGLTGRFVVTLFGFLSRRKGHLQAIEAMRALPQEAMLLIAGGRHPQDTSPYMQSVQAEIERHNLSERVRITGYLSEEGVAEAMAATDMVIAPFTESSGSGSLALAFACGKPIVASDITPHREVLEELPGAMRLYSLTDPEALSRAVAELMRRPEELRTLAGQSAAYSQMRSYGRMADETVALYDSILGGSS